MIRCKQPCYLFLAIGLVTVLGCAPLLAQVREAFVARYDGPASDDDEAYAIKIDQQGNIYVTGRSYAVGTGMDIATIKYDQDGSEQWIQRYDGPAHGDDVGRAMALDADGNIYVTGESIGLEGNFDYVTLKYDPAGQLLWERRYNGPENLEDRPVAIGVYNQGCSVPSQGCVFVTGSSNFGPETLFDYITVAYDRDGNQLWVARYDGDWRNDWATALTVDSDGYVYVTGYSWGIGTFYDYATIKYNPSGHREWVRRYNGPGYYYDIPSSVVVDAYGNVYVTGNSTSTRSYFDATTIKYGPSGDTLWVQSFNGDGERLEDNVANAIAIDPQGFVYVAGSSVVNGIGEYLIVQYDPEDGSENWIRYYRGPGASSHVATALAIDPSGNVFVTGRSYGAGTGLDYATLKYDSQGEQLWEARYNGPANRDDLANAIALDARGDVYVTGYSVGVGTRKDYATIKYTERLMSQPNSVFVPLW